VDASILSRPEVTSGDEMRTVTRRKLIGAGIAAALCVALPIGWVLAVFAGEMVTQLALGPIVRSKYGFSVGTPHVRAGGRSVEVLVLRVRPNGLLAKAGAMDGDLVLDPSTIGQLYRRLDSRRGTIITIRVVPGEDGPPLTVRSQRTITVISPG
jgi:hypothetical protein